MVIGAGGITVQRSYLWPLRGMLEVRVALEILGREGGGGGGGGKGGLVSVEHRV